MANRCPLVSCEGVTFAAWLLSLLFFLVRQLPFGDHLGLIFDKDSLAVATCTSVSAASSSCSLTAATTSELLIVL